ncbi:MAG: 4Fe-4S binding protein [Coriobacteriales bacterium]|jgi:ferredoxin|nr:4Fe-4S binding protein [Coriobacteriales bacterium]
MPVILDLVDGLSRLDTDDLILHPERCVLVRNRNAHCRRCLQACTPEAIRIENNTLSVDPDTCLGCGSCAAACPTMALEARKPAASELLEMSMNVLRETGQAPVFACEPLLDACKGTYDKSRVIGLGCLGRLEESELVALIASGMPAPRFAHAICADCDRARGYEVAKLVLETMRALLAVWGRDDPMRMDEGLPANVLRKRNKAAQTSDVDGVSRREFFTQIKTRMTEAASQAALQTLEMEQQALDGSRPRVVKVMADGTLPHFVPSRRERMLDHLALIGEPMAQYLDSRLWGYLRIDAKRCSACRMCATFCPTGAIAMFDDPGKNGDMGVEHYPADCVQCRLCEDICPTQAICIESKVPIKELIEGAIIRFTMQPPAHRLNDPKQIYHAMYKLLGGGQIYER